MITRQSLIAIFGITILSAQTYQVGDIVSDFTAPVCVNGDSDFQLYHYYGDVNGGDYRVIWINVFATWCVPCQDEAPVTETVFQSFKDQGLVAIGAGFDWNYPYSCEDWAQTFGITYPIADDATLDIVNAFGVPNIPYQIIIDHTMTLRYSEFGWNQEAVTDTIEKLLSEMPAVDIDESTMDPEYIIPQKAILQNAYPNPFNGMTTIRYTLFEPSKVKIDVFDALGRHISTLVSENHQNSGNHQIVWNDGKLTSGLYFIRLSTNNSVATNKVLLLK